MSHYWGMLSQKVSKLVVGKQINWRKNLPLYPCQLIQRMIYLQVNFLQQKPISTIFHK